MVDEATQQVVATKTAATVFGSCVRSTWRFDALLLVVFKGARCDWRLATCDCDSALYDLGCLRFDILSCAIRDLRFAILRFAVATVNGLGGLRLLRN
eukprot:9206151-Alexandrium_andersonii.AAC.1